MHPGVTNGMLTWPVSICHPFKILYFGTRGGVVESIVVKRIQRHSGDCQLTWSSAYPSHIVTRECYPQSARAASAHHGHCYMWSNKYQATTSLKTIWDTCTTQETHINAKSVVTTQVRGGSGLGLGLRTEESVVTSHARWGLRFRLASAWLFLPLDVFLVVLWNGPVNIAVYSGTGDKCASYKGYLNFAVADCDLYQF